MQRALQVLPEQLALQVHQGVVILVQQPTYHLRQYCAELWPDSQPRRVLS